MYYSYNNFGKILLQILKETKEITENEANFSERKEGSGWISYNCPDSFCDN